MSTAAEPAISAHGLGKCYRVYDRPADRLKQSLWGGRKPYFREFWALRDVSFDVARGETVGLIGRNGSGKSTLLQLVSGILAPTTGSFQVRGRVAALLELGSGFSPELSGRENVFMNAAILGLTDQEIAGRLDQIVAFAGIGDFLDRPVTTYSTGMVLRLAFAVAIHVDAEILIIDEALAVGDVGFQFQCIERLMRLTEAGTTLLLVSHDLSLVKTFCHRVLYLREGKVSASGSAEEMTELYFLDTWQPSGAAAGAPTVRRKPSLRGADHIAFGTDQGRIISAAFVASQGAQVAVRTGDRVEFDVEVEFAADVESPHLSVTLQDSRLLIIGGQSFRLSAEPRPDDGLCAARVRCRFVARLGAGAFFVSLRLEVRKSERLFVPIDKQVAALRLDVVQSPSDAFFGAVDLGFRVMPVPEEVPAAVAAVTNGHGGEGRAAPSSGLRILMVNTTLGQRTGTETAMRDLAFGLLATGQQPMVYAPLLGDIADELRDAGIPVTSDLSALPETPDLVHGNHHVETVQALLQFPTARGLFVCHDRTYFASAPPRLDRVRRYVAVDHYCLERLVDDYAIPPAQTRVIYNSVDTSRFTQREPLPERPLRAAIFSNYAGAGTHLEAVKVACARTHLPLDIIGSTSGNGSEAPERILGQYDVVFAKARCALEAMAVGTAVVLCDAQGVGPMVSTSALPDLRRLNFGRRTLNQPLSPEVIGAQIATYNAEDARAVSDYVRTYATVSNGVAEYQQLYDEIMAEPPAASMPAATELAEYLRASATRVQELQTALSDFRSPYRMEPLPAVVCASLGLEARAIPTPVASATAFQVTVDLDNASGCMLGSFPPFPVHLSYRWLVADSNAPLDVDAYRTALRPTLLPGARGCYVMDVVPPSEPGEYRLRLTLVQEMVMWMDLMPRPVFVDLAVAVT